MDNFFEYIKENFSLDRDGIMLVKNILDWVKLQSMDKEDTVSSLEAMLDGIGIEKKEIEKFFTEDDLYKEISFGKMYEELEDFGKNKNKTEEDFLEMAKKMHYMESEYIPMIKKKLNMEMINNVEYASVSEWITILKEEKIRNIIGWLECIDMDFMDMRRAIEELEL